MGETQVQKYDQIRENLTEEQMREYIATVPHLALEDFDALMRCEPVRHRAAAHAYAGNNPMAHLRVKITEGGWDGFAQMVANRGTVSSAKVAAGEWLVAARKVRALGFGGACLWAKLNIAAEARRAAFERSRRLSG